LAFPGHAEPALGFYPCRRLSALASQAATRPGLRHAGHQASAPTDGHRRGSPPSTNRPCTGDSRAHSRRTFAGGRLWGSR